MSHLDAGTWSKRWRTAVSSVLVVTTSFVLGTLASASSSSLPTLSQITSDVAASVTLKSAPELSRMVPLVSSMSDVDTSITPVRNGCLASSAATAPLPANVSTYCAYGDTSATRTILLTGDSQAGMWLPAADAMGVRLGWKVIFLSMRECGPWGNPNAKNFILYRNVTEATCNARNVAVATWATTHQPAVVLFSGRAYPAGYDIDVAPKVSVVESEMTTEVARYAHAGAKLIVLGPIPRYDTATTTYRPTDCLDGATAFVNCQLPLAKLLPQVEIQAETFEVNAGRFHYAKMFPLMCTTKICTITVQDGSLSHLVFYDGAHINRFFAVWVSQGFQEILAKLLPS